MRDVACIRLWFFYDTCVVSAIRKLPSSLGWVYLSLFWVVPPSASGALEYDCSTVGHSFGIHKYIESEL